MKRRGFLAALAAGVAGLVVGRKIPALPAPTSGVITGTASADETVITLTDYYGVGDFGNYVAIVDANTGSDAYFTVVGRQGRTLTLRPNP